MPRSLRSCARNDPRVFEAWQVASDGVGSGLGAAVIVTWHPVSEKPPVDAEYIGSGIFNGKRWVGGIHFCDGEWGDDGWVCDNITHWSSDWPEPPQ